MGSGTREETREAPFFSLFPSFPARFLFFDFMLFLLGYPARSLCRAESNEALIPYLYCRPFHCHDLFPRVERDGGGGAESCTQALDLE